jgi:RNA polymerase sigma-70 factor (ECF subfamily)
MGGQVRDPWFEDLVTSYHGRLVWFVAGLLGDEQHALDVAQETFVVAWRVRQRLVAPFAGGSDEVGARRWLYRVAYNRAISLLRHRQRLAFDSLEQLAGGDETDFFAPTPFEDQVVEAEVLRSALAHLHPDDAAAVLLHVVHGFTTNEIADVLGVSPGAATKRVWRAKERLRAAYFSQQTRRASVQGRA